jgi:hypothetical protein
MGSNENAFISRSRRCGSLRCGADLGTDNGASQVTPNLFRNGSPGQKPAELDIDFVDET